MSTGAEQNGKSAEPAAIPTNNPAKQSQAGRTCLAVVIGGGAAILFTVVFAIWWISRDGMPELIRADFDAAWQKWEQQGPASYRITTRVDGPQPATYTCTVSDRRVVSATRDGNQLSDVRTLGTWSVPGMFDTIEYDVDAIEGKGRTPEERKLIDLILRAEFDPEFGYPARYMRSDFNMKTTMIWTVIEFTVLTGSTSTEPEAD